MPNPISLSCGLAAHAVVRVPARQLEEFRKPPQSAPGASITNGFLKNVDVQTLVVLAALDQAIRDFGLHEALQAGELADWGVIAAPRFLGRGPLTPAISRYHAEGAWGVSPHLVVHRSLHSISGTVSQVFSLHGPNFGAGGGHGCEAEGLIAALTTLTSMNLPGVWLVLSRMEPDLPLIADFQIDPRSTIEALAVALVPQTRPAPMKLEISMGQGSGTETPFDLNVFAQLIDSLATSPAVSAPLNHTAAISLWRSARSGTVASVRECFPASATSSTLV